jgi:hypothetical protein
MTTGKNPTAGSDDAEMVARERSFREIPMKHIAGPSPGQMNISAR